MNNNVYFLILLVSILITSCNSKQKLVESSKYNKIVTKYTEIKQIISKEVDDTFYVYVRLPKNYESANKRYPVLYLLDGDISFNMATSIVRYLQYGKDVPDLIIVAPAYGTLLNDSEVNYRERDYTFYQIDNFAGSGGGERFLNFIEKELVPFVDTNYRTNNRRVLNGFSLGSLFALNILIKNPGIFNNYIVGSPYLVNDADQISKKLLDINFTPPLKNIFISVGELEETEKYKKPIKSIVDILKTKSAINVNFAEFKNATHFTSPAEALTFGLKFVFSETVYEEH